MRVLIALLWVALAFAQPVPPTNLRASTKPMATFVQGAVPTSAADPISCTFSSAPTEGNLLIAAMSERSGNSTTNHTISGSGWTKRVGRDVSLPSGDNRRTLTIWTKVAGASEPSTITMDDGGSGTSKNGFVAEYALESGEDTWEFLEAVSNDNGETDNATSLATGTTSSLSGTQMVVFGVGSMKAASGAPSGHTWASATLTANVSSYPSGLGSYGMWLGIASANSDSAGTKASTMTMGGGPSNDGLTAAILVFNLVSGGGGDDYTHSGTGALALSGSNTTVLDTIVSSSGNLAVSGTTGIVLEAIVTTSGALTFTGSHAAVLEAIAAVSGNLTLSGSAAVAPDWVVSSSGGFLLGGTGEPVPGFDLLGTGALSLGGSVSVEFTESGDIVYSGTGHLALAGAASIVLDAITSQSGNLALGGSGAIAPDFLIAGTGALSLAGSSALVPEFVLTPSGNLALSGSIATEANFVVAVSGDLELGGTAVVAYTGPVSTQVATSTIVVVPCVATVVKLDHRTVLLLQKPRTEVSLWKDIT